MPGAQHTEPGRHTTGTGRNWVGPSNGRQNNKKHQFPWPARCASHLASVASHAAPTCWSWQGWHRQQAESPENRSHYFPMSPQPMLTTKIRYPRTPSPTPRDLRWDDLRAWEGVSGVNGNRMMGIEVDLGLQLSHGHETSSNCLSNWRAVI